MKVFGNMALCVGVFCLDGLSMRQSTMGVKASRICSKEAFHAQKSKIVKTDI